MRYSVLSLSRFRMSELGEFAARVEALGYDALWLADQRFYREPYASLTYCATRTSRLQLGVGVTDPYTRHPALTAQAIATVDEASTGRAILGIGAGGSGFGALGLTATKPAQTLREAILLIQALLRGERVDVAGEAITFKCGQLDFAPLRSDIPIYVASNNRLGLRCAGEIADGAIMQGCVAEPVLTSFIERVDAGITAAQREPDAVDRVARIDVCVSDDLAAARDALRPGITSSLLAQRPRFWSFEQAGLRVTDEMKAVITDLPRTQDRAILAPAARLIPDEWVDALTIGGPPDRVAQEVCRLRSRGISHLMLLPVAAEGGDVITVVRRFATEVIPLLSA
jgi:5,10-methylenetetrahydromethanopterin reductase